jgi:hypothetical protein
MTPDDRPEGRDNHRIPDPRDHDAPASVGDGPASRGDAPVERRSPQILISDRQTGLPYSKGLMASQVMVTGLSPYRAYQVA